MTMKTWVNGKVFLPNANPIPVFQIIKLLKGFAKGLFTPSYCLLSH